MYFVSEKNVSILKKEYFLSFIFLSHCGEIKFFFFQPFVPVQIKFGLV